MGWIKLENNTIPFLATLEALKVRKDILARVIHWQLAKRRAGTHSTKQEADVAGSGKKIFRQKGTGNARQGSKRGPHFRGGAVIFGPQPRDHSYSLQKKVRKLGLMHAIASNAKNNGIFVYEDLNLESFKTRDLLSTVKEHFGENKKILFVDESNDNLTLALRNVHNVNVIPSCGLNVYDIMRHDYLVFSKAALGNVAERVSESVAG